MTTVHFDRRVAVLSLSGHAGAADRGRDLVCAALSALAETAAAQPGAETERGEARMTVRAAEERLAALAEGFRLLAREFPEFVTYVEDEA